MINESSSVVSDIGHCVDTTGLYLSDEPVSLQEVTRIAKTLGDIVNVSSITISSKQNPPVVLSRKKMKYHNDAPAADYLVWWAKTQGNPDELLNVIDLRDIDDYFSSEQIQSLLLTRAHCPRKYEERILNSYNDYPLLSRHNNQYKVNYTDWMVYDWPSEPLKNAFRAYVDDKSRYPTQIYLKQGHFVIINNNFLLHSRTQLNLGSPRNHTRLMVECRKK